MLLSARFALECVTAYETVCDSGRRAANLSLKIAFQPLFKMPVSFWLIPLTLESRIFPCNLRASLSCSWNMT